MNGVGGPEILVILVVALLVFGPKSIPEVARLVGRGMHQLRRLTTEFQREINLAAANEEEVAAQKPRSRDLQSTVEEPNATPTDERPAP